MSVRVRFAPSPTGFVHIGSLRTALYNYLLAKKYGGQYILRIEDTDQSRYVEGAIENLLQSMDWAGVLHDEGITLEKGNLVETGEYGPYVQSKRLDIYKKYIQILLDSGDAYYCFCSKERLDEVREKQKALGLTAKYDGHCKSLTKEEVQRKIEAGEEYVIRLKLPSNKDIEINDVIRGKVVVNTEEVDDQVLIKSDGFPTYHFAVVVDDYLMKITHVIRGEEWLPSTPKHVYLYEVLGWEAPQFVHLPNILNTEKKKLSKRQGDVSVEDFMKKGYLPEALVNYIALIGWSPEENREVFSMKELEEAFSLERVSKSGGVFDVNKLNWMNNHYIKESPIERITDLAIPYLIEAGYIVKEEVEEKYDWLKDMVSVFQDGLDYMKEIVEKVEVFFKAEFKPEDEEAEAILKLEHIEELLEIFYAKIEEEEVINQEIAKKIFKQIQKEKGIKGPNLFKPIRATLTGKVHGPDLPLMIQVLGKQDILSRIQYVKQNFI
ncbi:glutamate--tRNA ligase [Clostridium formicaceticum]|uniref:Glutamate--tRNA ligase n=1 Tax=Clostridium formicaceticum TaxID=1497 RepID=A0AAC9RR78_9CLOT|nr:glutamate--tRNA ligase [Clostridium formicaceticum]AOY75129.1 glutamate--tRNA ligase [Clostridium formicaceticum]ARE89553.1 Glutamate--tRNA ligase [Clostridium formicaceticum]